MEHQPESEAKARFEGVLTLVHTTVRHVILALGVLPFYGPNASGGVVSLARSSILAQFLLL
jgi:hypothetical protein